MYSKEEPAPIISIADFMANDNCSLFSEGSDQHINHTNYWNKTVGDFKALIKTQYLEILSCQYSRGGGLLLLIVFVNDLLSQPKKLSTSEYL